MKRRDTDTEPPRSKRSAEGGGEEMSGEERRSAYEETVRLTNMATAISAGVALVPIPGTSAALTGLDLLLIGAIGMIWGQPLTTAYIEGIFANFMTGVGLLMGLHAVGDVIGMIPGIGTLAKPALAAGCVKIVGSYLNDKFAKEEGKDHPAEVTAEEVKERLEKATARLAAYAPDLADGTKKAFQGDGKKLARTLRSIFGLEEEGQKK